MRKPASLIVAMGLASLITFTSLSRAQDNPPPPPDQQQDQGGGPGGPNGQGGPGGQNGPRQNPGFHIIPPFVLQRLELNSDQQEKIKELDAKVKAELEKILTPEQMKTLNEARPPRPQGQGGPGGPGAGQGGQQGGPGGGGPQRNNRPPRDNQQGN